MNTSIGSIDETLTGTTTPGESGPESNGNEEVHHITLPLRLEPDYQMKFNAISRALNGFKYCYLTLIILFNIHSFVHSWRGFRFCYFRATDPQQLPSSTFKIK